MDFPASTAFAPEGETIKLGTDQDGRIIVASFGREENVDDRRRIRRMVTISDRETAEIITEFPMTLLSEQWASRATIEHELIGLKIKGFLKSGS